MGRKLLCTAILLLSAHLVFAADDDARLFRQLDSLLNIRETLRQEKETQIERIRERLSIPHITPEQEYAVNDRLYQEYLAFKYDSAYKYVNRNLALAQTIGNRQFYDRSILQLVHILSVAGLFDQAAQTIARIDTTHIDRRSLTIYYQVCSDLYLFNAEFTQGTVFFKENNDKAQKYRKKILEARHSDPFLSVMSHASFIGERREYRKAIDMLTAYVDKHLHPGERNYSIAVSTLAYFYSQLNDRRRQKHYLLLCAISDLQGCIKENNSLRELASLLFDEGDLAHAYDYINASILDANFYGTRLRNIQAAQLIPKIVQGYHQSEARHRTRLYLIVVALSVVMLLLVVAVFFMRRYNRRYRMANHQVKVVNRKLNTTVEELRLTNALLHEDGQIKEQYIGRFMELASILMDREEERRKTAYRLARDHRTADLNKFLQNTDYASENIRLFYANFDEAFLNIYTDFVDQVNALLLPDHRFATKGKSLNTELRILALIRLNIADNQKISSILGMSITTVYTYRSKLKSHSFDKETFEEKVASIDTFGAEQQPRTAENKSAKA